MDCSIDVCCAVASGCIVVLTIVSVSMGLDETLRTVGDMGQLPASFPMFLLPDVPINLETLMIILPYAISLAIVGLLESLMTATIVDDFTDTSSSKNRECAGQGISNVVAGFFGGLAGCAMIGQSVINVKSGGRGRLSTFSAGIILLILILVLDAFVKQIPMAALVAVMIMVSIGTFSWQSVKNLKLHPRSSSCVMVATVLITVFSHNLALGVGVGVLLSALFFAFKVSVCWKSTLPSKFPKGAGLFCAWSIILCFGETADAFDFREVLDRVRIDVTQAISGICPQFTHWIA